MFVKGIKGVAGAAVLLAVSALGWLALRPAETPQARASISGLKADENTDRYTRAFQPRTFLFPADHGPHPDYQTEWWYYTGNVQDAAGRPFGYQLTFFRRALTPPPAAGFAFTPTRTSRLATNQLYFAHLGVTDTDAGKHVEAERFSRGSGGLAGACAAGSAIPCEDGEVHQAFLLDWSAVSVDEQGDAVRLTARDGAYGLDLTLRPSKPAVAHGERGLSPKSLEPGNASYYYSSTRLETTGRITTEQGVFDVTGLSWMDHEWSTSALGPNAVGWDWFSIQLDDQRELMYFQVRNADGTLEPASAGTLVEPDGRGIPLAKDDVLIEVLESWSSPKSGGEYPVKWRVSVPSHDISLDLEAS